LSSSAVWEESEPKFRRLSRSDERAAKKIGAGDEITYNYGRDYLVNVITRRGCKCDKCRKKRADARAKARAKSWRANGRAAAD
jgi:hypothetical protein